MTVGLFLSNTVWTFWNLMFLFFIWIPCIMLWFYAMTDIFRRRDLSGLGKAGWLVLVVILPWLGTFIYIIARPKEEVYGYSGYYGYPAGYYPGTVNNPYAGTPMPD